MMRWTFSTLEPFLYPFDIRDSMTHGVASVSQEGIRLTSILVQSCTNLSIVRPRWMSGSH